MITSSNNNRRADGARHPALLQLLLHLRQRRFRALIVKMPARCAGDTEAADDFLTRFDGHAATDEEQAVDAGEVLRGSKRGSKGPASFIL